MALMPDPVEGLIAFLLADADLASLVSTRVYGVELPFSEADNQPQKAVVLRHAGGGVGVGSDSVLDVGTLRVDAFNYGETPYEARKVRRASYRALKKMGRTKQGTVVLLSAVQAGGPVDLRFSATDWPAVIESWILMHAEIAA
jgi:hypothetical protein